MKALLSGHTLDKALPGHQQTWEDVSTLVAWARAFGYTPDQVEELPIDFYNLALDIDGLFEARKQGVSFSFAEAGWVDIDLKSSG